MTTGLGPKSGDIAFRKDFAFDKRVRLQKTQGLFLKHEIPVRMEVFFGWKEEAFFLYLPFYCLLFQCFFTAVSFYVYLYY